LFNGGCGEFYTVLKKIKLWEYFLWTKQGYVNTDVYELPPVLSLKKIYFSTFNIREVIAELMPSVSVVVE
jgi:hypothetical protein